MQNGLTLKHNYGLDLDTVQTGAVIGMKRHIDGTLHYYLDGEDKGEACSGLPLSIYPVIDLYGQCAQVSWKPTIFTLIYLHICQEDLYNDLIK